MGMLSLERIIAPQRGQWERGRTIDSWRGRREMQTFRKLPNAKPKTEAQIPVSRAITRLILRKKSDKKSAGLRVELCQHTGKRQDDRCKVGLCPLKRTQL
jgi:hypothetical protein